MIPISVLTRCILHIYKAVIGVLSLVIATTVLAASAPVAGVAIKSDPYKDPLDVPAMMVKRQLTTTQMQAVARAGERLVAVGIRGLVLISDDGGKQWKQVAVPVSSDLTDINFPTAKDGWIVGQDGVVLHSKDGGTSWEKQLDGNLAKKLLTEHFQAQINAGKTEAQRYLQDTQLNYESGPEQALLGVWFKDAQNGFVCGSFGTLLATRDGGVTWESWAENIDSDIAPHLYAIRGTQKGMLIGSEKGVVFRLDEQKQRFVAMQTGYTGTFFSLLEVGDAVLAMGLRGNVYRLKGDGKQWEKLETGINTSITASTLLPDGSALLATVAGQLLITKDGGNSFQPVPVMRPMSYAGITAAAPGTAVVVGSGGVSAIPLK